MSAVILTLPSSHPVRDKRASEQVEDDMALLARIAQRDERALEALYARYGSSLFSLCMKMLGNREEAEEALQDALVRIWKRSPTYDPQRSAPFSWAVMITRSLCVDKLRSRKKVVPFGNELPEEVRDESAPSPSSEVIREDGASQLRERLKELPLEQRLCIEMAFFGGQTHQEIAYVLDEPLGTVKARIRRGLLKLRSIVSSS